MSGRGRAGLRLLGLLLPLVLLPLLLGTPGPPEPATQSAATSATPTPEQEPTATPSATPTGEVRPPHRVGRSAVPRPTRSAAPTAAPTGGEAPGRPDPGTVPPCTVPPFVDVRPAHPFCAEIAEMARRSVVTGFADGTFHPSMPASRGMVAAAVARTIRPADRMPPCRRPAFPDVAADHPNCPAIRLTHRQGLMTGYPDGTFRPAEPVTRLTLAVILARPARISDSLLACQVAPFTDIPARHAFCPELRWLNEKDIAAGYPDGTFRPSAPLTRAVLARMLVRAAP